MAPVLDAGGVTRSVVFVVCLAVLLVAHQVGDHVLQTDHQAAAKTGSGWPAARAMAGHLISYHLLAVGLLLSVFALLGLPVRWPPLLAGLVFSAVTHGLLDRRWPVRMTLRLTRASQFAAATTPVSGLYLADQALHHLALLVSALLIAGW